MAWDTELDELARRQELAKTMGGAASVARQHEHWQPDWSVPPGDVLLEALEERSITQAELARRMGRPLKTINEIVKAKAAITPDTAIQLERALGVSAQFWNGLAANYRA